MQMIFERRGDGSPVPKLPTDRGGKLREADGVRFFSIDQAVDAFKMSHAELRTLYDDAFGDLFPDPTVGAADGDDEAGPLGLREIDPARVLACRRDLLKAHRFAHLADSELDVVLEICARRSLDPWRHVYAEVGHDPQRGRREVRIITTIDAFRLIATRTGLYDGTTEPEYLDADGEWHVGVWPAELGNPVAARRGVRRKGFSEPQVEVARWDRYCQYVQTDRGLEVSDFWVKGGPEQLAKCALALAFRAAFPEEIGGLYTREEMGQATNPPPIRRAAQGGPPDAAARVGYSARAVAEYMDADDIEIDDSCPATPAEFEAALERFGFTTPERRQAVINKLKMGIPHPSASKTFWAAAIKRLQTRPDLYGAVAGAAA